MIEKKNWTIVLLPAKALVVYASSTSKICSEELTNDDTAVFFLRKFITMAEATGEKLSKK